MLKNYFKTAIRKLLEIKDIASLIKAAVANPVKSLRPE